MATSTLEYYETAATDLVRRYEAANVAVLQADMLGVLRGSSPVLELGCGSGRDAAFLLAQGVAVTATDGCASMVARAEGVHPELGGHLQVVVLPGTLPFPDGAFGGLLSVAALMHLTPEEIRGTMAEVHRVLRPRGRAFVSVPSRRADVDDDGFDDKGRRFTGMVEDGWRALFADAGFRVSFRRETADGLGRPGVRWYSFGLERG